MNIYDNAPKKDLSNFHFRLNNRILIRIGIILFFPITAWSNGFDARTERFKYSDNTFYYTVQPNYASANYNASEGISRGAVHVAMALQPATPPPTPTPTPTPTPKPAPTPTPSSVTSPNQPPTLNLVANPSSGQSPLYVTFESNASDPDGNIAEYRWDYDGNGTVDDITPSNPVEFIYITPGTYNAKVEVVDNDGMSASDSVTVNVSSPPQPAPTPTPNPTTTPTLTPTSTSEPTGPTFYMSPTGSNSNSGTSTSSPWKTLKYAIPKLLAGDSLILMDGTYTKSTTGLPYVSCGSNGSAKNGTATKPITIKAENERQAFLSSDGSVEAFKMQNCSYWNIEGLRLGANDFNTTMQIPTAWVISSNNINIRKILAFKQNRLSPNAGLFAISKCDTVLVEDSEFYASMRHLLNCFSSQRCTFRRVYANARDFKPAGSSTCPFGIGAGQCSDRSVVFYGSSNSIMENVIVEGNDEDSEGMQIHSTAEGNKILGSISLNAFRNGMRLDSRKATTNLVKDTIIENYVAISTNAIGGFGGLFHAGAVNTIVRQATILNTHGPSTARGINLDGRCGGCGGQSPPTASFYGVNILAANNKWSGFYVNPSYPTLGGWDIDYSVAYNHSINFNPPGGDAYGDFTNEAAVNPALGSCIVYIPSSSPMKGWGKSGEDIGANIVYRYEDGVLTDQKLWNQTTGQFPCGATVKGVNDDATFPDSSCVNVHKRLNVGVKGCPIP